MIGGASVQAVRQAQALFSVGSATGLSDGELIGRFLRHRDDAAEAAFEAIVARHGPMVLGVCRRVLANPHDVDDAFQATFLVLARRAGSLRGGQSLGPWLFGVTRKVAARTRTRNQPSRWQPEERSSHEPLAPVDQTVENRDLRQVIDEELARLPRHSRDAVVLCHLEGLTHEEAANRLGWPVGTVRSRLARARDRLRKQLRQRGVDEHWGMLAPVPILPALAARTASAAAQFAGRTAQCLSAQTAATTLASTLVRKAAAVRLGLVAVSSLVLGSAVLVAGTRGFDSIRNPSVDPRIGLPLARPAPAPPEAAPPPAAEDSAGKAPTFSILVVDESTGKPISGATIRAYLDPGKEHFTTDAAGRAQLPRPRGKRYDITLDAWADGFQSRRIGFSNRKPRVKPIPAEPRIELKPGELTVGGTVVNEQGQPIPGVEVGMNGLREGETALAFFDMMTKTDANGRWSSRGMPKNLSQFSTSFFHPEYLDKFGDRDQSIVNLDQLKSGAQVTTLKRGVTVRGRVLDEQGNPIAGAEIIQPEFQGTAFRPSARTGADGRFTFPSAFRPVGETPATFRPDDPRNLLVTAPLRSPELLPIRPKVGMADLEIRLRPGHIIRGRALDPSGEPIDNAWVFVRRWRNVAWDQVLTSTGRDGRFVWDAAPEDDVTLDVSAAGYETDELTVKPSDREYVWGARPRVSVDLRVTDSQSGKPITRFESEVGRVKSPGMPVEWGKPHPNITPDAIRMTHLFGRAVLSLDSGSAAWRIRILAQGYRPQETDEIRPGEESVRVNLKLTRLAFGEGGGPSGLVVDESGTPLENAEVMLATLRERANLFHGNSWWLGQGILVWSGAGTVMTNAQGQFTFSPTNERFRLGVVHENGYGEADDQTVRNARRIVAHPWGRIEGTVLVGGRPAAHVKVSASIDTPNADRAEISGGLEETTTDAQGRFAFDRIRPGPWVLSASNQSGLNTGRTYFHVSPGGTSRVTLGGPGRPVVGLVRLTPSAGPAQGVWVTVKSDRLQIPYPRDLNPDQQVEWLSKWISSPEGISHRHMCVERQGSVQGSGRFRIDDLPEGDYVLEVWSSGPVNNRQPAVIKAEHRFKIPPISGGRTNEPLDLGTIRVPLPEETMKSVSP